MINFFSMFSTFHIGLVVFSLFGFGLFLVFRAHRILNDERSSLHTTRGFIQQGAEVGGLLSDKINRRVGGFWKFKPVESLVWHRIRTLEEVRKNSGRFDRDSLSVVTRSRLQAQTASLRYIAGILILIGLFGTLCGLTGAVSGLSNAVQDNKTAFSTTAQVDNFINQLRFELSHTLSGMRMAFVASLFGVFSTIVLTAFVTKLNRAQHAFLAEFESFTTSYLLPVYLPKTEETNLQNIAQVLNATSLLMRDVVEKFQIEHKQKDQILTAVGTISSMITVFVNEIKTREFSVFEGLAGSVDKLSGAVDKSQNAYAIAATAVNQLKSSMKELSDVEVEKRDLFIRSVQKELGSFATNLNDGFDALIRKLDGQAETNKETVTVMGSNSTQIRTTLEDLKRHSEDSKNVMLNLKNELVASDRFKNLQDEITSQTAILRDMMGNGSSDESLKNILSGISLQIKDANLGKLVASEAEIRKRISVSDNQEDSLNILLLLKAINQEIRTANNTMLEQLKNDHLHTMQIIKESYAQSSAAIAMFNEAKKLRAGGGQGLADKTGIAGRSDRSDPVMMLVNRIDRYFEYQRTRKLSHKVGRFFSAIGAFIRSLFGGAARKKSKNDDARDLYRS